MENYNVTKSMTVLSDGTETHQHHVDYFAWESQKVGPVLFVILPYPTTFSDEAMERKMDVLRGHFSDACMLRVMYAFTNTDLNSISDMDAILDAILGAASMDTYLSTFESLLLEHPNREVLVAWSNYGMFEDRDLEIMEILRRNHDGVLHCLGTTRQGSPKSLRGLSKNTKLEPYEGRE